jgi:hypothetical protein
VSPSELSPPIHDDRMASRHGITPIAGNGIPLAVETLTGEMQMRAPENQNNVVDTITID